MNKWKQRPNSKVYSTDFENFDLAWEFMHFLAKLARSSDCFPEIVNMGNKVSIGLADDIAGNRAMFSSGVLGYFKKSSEQNVVTETTQSGAAQLFTDGGSRGNPGPSASGFVVYNQEKRELSIGGTYLGVTTNNQAEYHSLKDGLRSVVELGFKKVVIHMDSQLVVNQIKGTYKVKNRDLYPLHESIKNILKQFDSYEIIHIPRELNKVADSVVNKILDETTK